MYLGKRPKFLKYCKPCFVSRFSKYFLLTIFSFDFCASILFVSYKLNTSSIKPYKTQHTSHPSCLQVHRFFKVQLFTCHGGNRRSSKNGLYAPQASFPWWTTGCSLMSSCLLSFSRSFLFYVSSIQFDSWPPSLCPGQLCCLKSLFFISVPST